MNQRIKWAFVLVLVLLAAAPFVYARLVDAALGPIALLVPVASLLVPVVYIARKKFGASNQMVTIVHAAAWIFILAGMKFELQIPSFMGAVAALGVISSHGILLLVTVVAAIGAAITLFYKRNVYALNAVIFSASFLALQIVGALIFIPGVAAH